MQIEAKLGNDSVSSIRVRFAWSGGVVFLIVNFWRLVPRCCYRRAGVPPVTRSRVEKWCSQLLGSVASSGSIGNGTLIQSTVGLVKTFQLATSEDIAKSLLLCCTHVAGGRGEFAMECVLSMAEAMASMDATMMSAVLANDVRASLAWVEAVAQLFADRSHTSNVFWRRKGQRGPTYIAYVLLKLVKDLRAFPSKAAEAIMTIVPIDSQSTQASWMCTFSGMLTHPQWSWVAATKLGFATTNNGGRKVVSSLAHASVLETWLKSVAKCAKEALAEAGLGSKRTSKTAGTDRFMAMMAALDVVAQHVSACGGLPDASVWSAMCRRVFASSHLRESTTFHAWVDLRMLAASYVNFVRTRKLLHGVCFLYHRRWFS